MKHGKLVRVVAFLFGIILVSGSYFSFVWAENQATRQPSQPRGNQIGEIRQIQGTVVLRHAGESRFQPVTQNTPILLEDTVGTDRNSKAWCVLSSGPRGSADEAHCSLGENSSLEFMRFDRQGPSSVFSGGQGQGIVRYIKNLSQTNPPSSFSIATPTASIEVLPSERPADFVVEVVNENVTVVYGIWGAVKVRSISEEFTQERVVRSCQKVTVERNKEPSPVTGVSPDVLLQLIKRTTIPNTLPEDVPTCRPDQQEPPYVEGPPVSGCPCPPGEEMVGDNCQPCPRWRPYDPNSCGCVSRCRYDNHCRRCEHCRGGRCVPITCGPGEWLDRETCQCRTRCSRTESCPPGYWFNPKTCRCERRCDIRECPQGQWLDVERCRCVKEPCHRTCPPGQKLDPRTCTCESKCNKTCPPNEWLNYKTCECEPRCRRHCPAGQRLNRETCTCEPGPECKRKCPQGQRLDRETCTCVAEPTIMKEKQGCRSDADCGPGMSCRQGKCVSGGERIQRQQPEPKHKKEIPKQMLEPTQPAGPTPPPGRQLQEVPRQVLPGRQAQ